MIYKMLYQRPLIYQLIAQLYFEQTFHRSFYVYVSPHDFNLPYLKRSRFLIVSSSYLEYNGFSCSDNGITKIAQKVSCALHWFCFQLITFSHEDFRYSDGRSGPTDSTDVAIRIPRSFFDIVPSGAMRYTKRTLILRYLAAPPLWAEGDRRGHHRVHRYSRGLPRWRSRYPRDRAR